MLSVERFTKCRTTSGSANSGSLGGAAAQVLELEAVAEGDFFLVRELTRALGDELPAAQWRATSEAAAAAGKERYAASAHRMAERAEGRS